MNEATEADLARDLKADLALCEAAPPGPWLDLCAGSDGQQRYVAPPRWRGMPVLYSYCPPHAALDMACAARDGWPAAIRLAMHWRAEAEKLKAAHQTTFNFFTEEVRRRMESHGKSLEQLVECRNQLLDRDEEIAALKAELAAARAAGVKEGVEQERQRTRRLRDAIREWNDSAGPGS